MAIRSVSGGERPSHPELGPFHFACLNHIAHAPLATGQAGGSGLHLQKYDALQPTCGKPIEHYQINRAAEKANVLGIVGEIREIWDQLFMHLSHGHGLTPLDRIGANDRGVPYPPDQEVHPGNQQPDRDTGDEPRQVR